MCTVRSSSDATGGFVGDALQAAAGAILTKGDPASKLMDENREVIMTYIRCVPRSHADLIVSTTARANAALVGIMA